jgi:hypothetical protein
MSDHACAWRVFHALPLRQAKRSLCLGRSSARLRSVLPRNLKGPAPHRRAFCLRGERSFRQPWPSSPVRTCIRPQWGKRALTAQCALSAHSHSDPQSQQAAVSMSGFIRFSSPSVLRSRWQAEVQQHTEIDEAGQVFTSEKGDYRY